MKILDEVRGNMEEVFFGNVKVNRKVTALELIKKKNAKC